MKSPQMIKVVKEMNKLTVHDLAIIDKLEPEAVTQLVGIIKIFNEHISAPDLSYGLTPKEVNMMANSQKIHAIKSVRERTGMGLADAKRFVEDAVAKLGLQDLNTTPF